MKKLIVLMVLTLVFASCSNDNDDEDGTVLEGKWTLTNVVCFCAFGNDPDFSGHKITFDGNILSVENTGQFNFLTNVAGTYSLQEDVITLKNGQQYKFVIKQDVLELIFVDEPLIADDEILLEYERS